MAVLEIGINLGTKKLIEIRYYSSMDNVLDPKIRTLFVNGLEDFFNEVFDDDINVISLSNFEMICYYEIIQFSNEDTCNSLPLLLFAIIEKGTDHDFVKQHLKKICSLFLESYLPNEFFTKNSKFFKNFEPQIDKILGDLRLKLEDRIKSVFKHEI